MFSAFRTPVVTNLYWLMSVWIKYMVLKNYVYNVSGMIEEVKQTFFIWQNFGLCTVLPLDDLMCRRLDFRNNTHRLVLFVLMCLQHVERVITVSTKTCYDKYSKYVCIYYPFSCHSIPAMLKRVYVCTTWRFPFVVVHCIQYTWYITDGWVHSERAYGHAYSVSHSISYKMRTGGLSPGVRAR